MSETCDGGATDMQTGRRQRLYSSERAAGDQFPELASGGVGNADRRAVARLISSRQQRDRYVNEGGGGVIGNAAGGRRRDPLSSRAGGIGDGGRRHNRTTVLLPPAPSRPPVASPMTLQTPVLNPGHGGVAGCDDYYFRQRPPVSIPGATGPSTCV